MYVPGKLIVSCDATATADRLRASEWLLRVGMGSELFHQVIGILLVLLHGQGITLASIFWGLWLFPFGMLVIRSGFIPRFLGYLMMIAGVGYLASATTTVLMPEYSKLVGQYAIILEMGELPIMFWLLIWGARTRPAEARAS